jgi:hypothetical protein
MAAAAAAAAAAVAVAEGHENWRPWGLCAHGPRIFATGHAGGRSSTLDGDEDDEGGSSDAATASAVAATATATVTAGGGANGSGSGSNAKQEEEGSGGAAEGCVRVWEEGSWRLLRRGLKEPNYILVC